MSGAARRRVITRDDSFAGRSILDLEAERVQLEDALDRARSRPGPGQAEAVSVAERRLAAVTVEIMHAGHSGA